MHSYDKPGYPVRKTGFGSLLARMTAFFGRYAGSRVITGLTAQIEFQNALIDEQARELAHSRKIFDRASAAAQIGVWECSLPDNSLKWTDVVYDIFEMPRGSALERERIVEFYTEESLKELGVKRTRAIAERGGFGMDAEIITAKGNHRWMRITATVECENGVPVRIFGMKQDITEEKNMIDRTRYLANFDQMTGLANRAQFQSRFAAFCDDTPDDGTTTALVLIDLDGFKAVNDTHGHAAGDACLKEAANRLRSICEGAELIARIGGDEFAVLLCTQEPAEKIFSLTRDVIEGLRRPLDHHGSALRIGASAGIAFAGGSTPSELFRRADLALYAAKAAGRNTFRLFEAGETLSEKGSWTAA